jgi:uncharacterized protein YjiS (DUF1127 family)
MYGQIYDKAVIVSLPRHGARTSLLRRLDRAFAAAFDRFLVWQDRIRSRRMLRGLDDHMLRDIGIDRSDAEREGSMPFWR